jgi:hypothetical protein
MHEERRETVEMRSYNPAHLAKGARDTYRNLEEMILTATLRLAYLNIICCGQIKWGFAAGIRAAIETRGMHDQICNKACISRFPPQRQETSLGMITDMHRRHIVGPSNQV